jgi:hypothetical protein
MQTFVPYPDLRRTAAVLDDKRLGKQRVETMQIIRALTRETYGWKRHPAVRMWEGHVPALGLYASVICEEWTARGHADTCDATIRGDLADAGFTDIPATQDEADLPAWWGDEAVHRSHRSSLLRKDPEHYRPRFEPDLPDDLEYVWPVQVEKPTN